MFITNKDSLDHLLENGQKNLYLPSIKSTYVYLEYLKDCYFSKIFFISKNYFVKQTINRLCTTFELIKEIEKGLVLKNLTIPLGIKTERPVNKRLLIDV